MEVIYEPFKTRPLIEFHDELRFEFPDLPSQLFDYYILKTAITMAKQGNLIRRCAIINASHGVTRYRLESPDGMDIAAILGVRSAPGCGCGSYAITRSFDPPEGAFSCGQDIAWYDDIEQVFHVRPPYCHGQYYVTLAVTPRRDSCELPDAYYTEYLPTLMMGTRGSMLLIANRPWTNLQLGQAYYNEFLQLITQDSIDAATHKMRGSVKMKFGKVM